MSENKFSLNDMTTAHEMEPPLMTIYGGPGVGKSHLVAQIPNHIMIRTGDGLGKLKPNSFPMSKTYKDVMDQIDVLIESEHNLSVLAIDTLTSFEHLLQMQAVEDWNDENVHQRVKLISEPAYGAGYAYCMSYWHEFLGKINTLQETKKMAVIFIAHSDEKSQADPLNPTFMKYKVKIDKNPNKLLNEKCDLIAFMKIKTSLIKDKKGFSETIRADTTGQRVLCCNVHPAYEAKNRYSLPDEIPANWDSLMTHISKVEE